uniref:Uncharacterized protein n=1 Tax=Anguilla anguilla TaxID=7936 RepID=A0A0E9TJ12_ANGAN
MLFIIPTKSVVVLELKCSRSSRSLGNAWL